MNVLVRALALLVVLIVGWSAPSSALAQSAWREIATNPFTGTPEEVCRLQEAEGNIAFSECMRGVAMQQSGQCALRQLKDGEILHVSFTRDGVHGIEYKRVAFGQSVALDDSRRRAYDCDLGGGTRLILPLACGNWSVMRNFSPVPQPAPRVTIRETYLPGSYYHVAGIHINGGYCAGDIYLPSVSGMTPGAIQKSTTTFIDGQ